MVVREERAGGSKGTAVWGLEVLMLQGSSKAFLVRWGKP